MRGSARAVHYYRMNFRFELHIGQLDPLWRVTVRDRGRRVPEYCREYPSRDEAVAYAKGRAQQMQASGHGACVLLAEAGGQTVLWTSDRDGA